MSVTSFPVVSYFNCFVKQWPSLFSSLALCPCGKFSRPMEGALPEWGLICRIIELNGRKLSALIRTRYFLFYINKHKARKQLSHLTTKWTFAKFRLYNLLILCHFLCSLSFCIWKSSNFCLIKINCGLWARSSALGSALSSLLSAIIIELWKFHPLESNSVEWFLSNRVFHWKVFNWGLSPPPFSIGKPFRSGMGALNQYLWNIGTTNLLCKLSF